MKTILCALIVAGLFNTITVHSQDTPAPVVNAILKGKVIDAKTETPLVSVSLQIKGVTNGTASDQNGEFTLYTGQKFPFKLIISSVGYISQEIVVNASPVIIKLVESENKLDDVVVVGYGTRQRKNLVGAVTKVDPKSTTSIPEGSFDAQLQGKIAGVQISTNAGIPGQDVFIRVRGTTSINGSNNPLYIIDGVYINSSSLQHIDQDRTPSPIADINPSDIESVEVLKDAVATAIYGSRGANGVIIITTKGGKYGSKAKVKASVLAGSGWAPKERQKYWALTDGEEFATLINEYNKNMGQPIYFRPKDQGGAGLPEEQPTYDRMAYVWRTARLNDYNVSVDGGSEKINYYLAVGHNKQQSIWNPIDFQRTSLKLNLNSKISDYVTIGSSNTVSAVLRDPAKAANGPDGTILQSSLNIPTYLPIFDNNGTPLIWGTPDNIAVITDKSNIKSKTARYIGNLYFDINFSSKLKLRSNWGLDYANFDESEYWETDTKQGAPPVNGKASSSLTRSTNWFNEQTINYADQIGKHRFNVLVGNTLQGEVLQNTHAFGSNFPSDAFRLISAAANKSAEEEFEESRLVSFFSAINYNFDDKYLLEATYRADASSKFGINHRWGYFPSIGGAWKIKREPFLKNVRFINDLKLRAGYGITGNQGGIGAYASPGLWSAGSGYPDSYGTAEGPSLIPLQSPNPDLKWEKTTQFNIGFDAVLFNNRINVEFNWYNKYTKDVLLAVAVSGVTGFQSYLSNYGEISNKGFEFAITSTNISTKDFRWSTSFNISQNKNNVERIVSPMNYGTRDVVRIEQGKPLYSFWMYNQVGVNPQTGDIIYEDVDKNGSITVADRYLVANTWPKFFGGLTNDLRYKNFDLSIFFTYSEGNHLYNLNKVFGERGGTLGPVNRSLFKSQLDRWTTPGQITDLPKLTSANYSIYQNSRYVEDGSFLRLRQVSLGYSFSKKIVERLRLSALRVYAVGTNLFLITPYTGLDPESNMEVGGQNTQGYDYGLPPQPRTIQFGLNVTF
ncbi:MAG: TonB-dependent receptor [Bacteroidota bacterium]